MLKEVIIENELELQKKLKERSKINKLILWGCGEGAHNVMQMLNDLGIVPDCVAINRMYFSESKKFDGYEVKIIEDVLEENSCSDIIVAFRGYSKDCLIEHKEKIGEIYDYDIWAGKFSYIPFSFFQNNSYRLEKVYSMLSDQKSKETFAAYLNQRISGKYGYLKKVKSENQYFDDIVPLYDDNIFIDCGAYNGDSAMGFYNFCCKKGKNVNRIVSFEMDSNNIKMFKENIQIPNVELIEKGIWSKEETLYLNNDTVDTSREIVTSGDTAVFVDSIDNILCG